MDNSKKGVIRTIIEKRIEELERLLATSSEEDDARTRQLNDEATRLDALANLSVDRITPAPAVLG